MGDALVPMLLSFGGICLLRSGWLLAVVPVWNNMKTVMFSYPLTWIVTSVLFIIYYCIYVRRHTRKCIFNSEEGLQFPSSTFPSRSTFTSIFFFINPLDDVSFIYPLLLYLCAAAQDRVAIVPVGKR